MPGYALESREKLLVDQFCAKLFNELVVVDCLDDTVFADLSGNLETKKERSAAIPIPLWCGS